MMNPYRIGIALKPFCFMLLWLLTTRVGWTQSNISKLTWLKFDRAQVQWLQGYTAQTKLPDVSASMQRQVQAVSVRYLQPLADHLGILVGADRAWYHYNLDLNHNMFERMDNFSQAYLNEGIIGLGVRTQSKWLYVLSYQENYANLLDNRTGKTHQWRSQVVKGEPLGNAFGVGVSVRYGDFGRLYFVYPVIRYKNKDDTWRISGSSNVYFSGPLGVKVTYKINDWLRVGGGQSYLKVQFMGRHGDITETKQWLAYLNSEWTISQNWLLSASAGYLFGGNLYFNDEKISTLSPQFSVGSSLLWRY
ncbi:MAG: hypothetical protein ISP86_05875 [Shewanellaceae bacterium]|nr:hypothetical protein [Shewanellaceae bacterium]